MGSMIFGAKRGCVNGHCWAHVMEWSPPASWKTHFPLGHVSNSSGWFKPKTHSPVGLTTAFSYFFFERRRNGLQGGEGWRRCVYVYTNAKRASLRVPHCYSSMLPPPYNPLPSRSPSLYLLLVANFRAHTEHSTHSIRGYGYICLAQVFRCRQQVYLQPSPESITFTLTPAPPSSHPKTAKTPATTTSRVQCSSAHYLWKILATVGVDFINNSLLQIHF